MILDEIKKIARNKEKTSNYVQDISQDEAFQLATEMLKDNPYFFQYPLQEIFVKFFSDNEKYINLLNELIKVTMGDGAAEFIFGPIKEKAIKHIELLKKIIDCSPPLNAGILMSWIPSEDPKSTITFIKKQYERQTNESVQSALFLIRICLDAESFQKHEQVLQILFKIRVPPDENLLIGLLWAYNSAYKYDPSKIEPLLIKLISSYSVLAQVFLNSRFFKRDSKLIKFCIKLLNGNNDPEKTIINGLLDLLDSDPVFVFEIIELWLRSFSFPHTMDADYLIREANKKYEKIFLNMVTRLLSDKNSYILNFGANLLNEAYTNQEDKWVDFIEDWIGIAEKEKLMVSSLRRILSNYLERNPYLETQVKNRCITLTKSLAKLHDIDYNKVISSINLSKEQKDGWQNKQDACRALKVLKLIAHPPRDINIKLLEKNLIKFPNVHKAFKDNKWIDDDLIKFHPHYLCYVFSREISTEEEINKIKKKLENVKDKNEQMKLNLKVNSLISTFRECYYWEEVFKKIEKSGVKFSKKKMEDIDRALDTLSEIEVASKLIDNFLVSPEPKIPILEPKKLDFKIIDNSYEFLIEVARVEPYIMDELSTTVHTSDSGKIKKVLLNKLRDQLQNGEKDPKLPIVLILNLTGSYYGQYEVMDAIYGQQTFYWKMIRETGKIVEEGASQKENSFFMESGSDIVSALIVYSRDFLRKDIIEGRMYTVFPIKQKNSLDKKYWIKLRNVFLGTGNKSVTETLTKINGINKENAKILYENGVEDIGILASIDINSFLIKDFSKETMYEWQKEAQRIIALLQTASLKYLKNIDEETLNILHKNGIFTYNQLKEFTGDIKGVKKQIIEELLREIENTI